MPNYLKIKTSLDQPYLKTGLFQVRGLKGREGLCKDFEYTLDMVSRKRLTEKQFDQLLGDSVTVSIGFSKNDLKRGQRFINGIIYRMKEIGMSKTPLVKEIWHYQITIGSWLTQLKQVKDCRIFQKNGNTSLSIITGLLTELELRDFKTEISSNYPGRDYITQYDESTADFIIRLLQNEGILWRFEHQDNRHILVFFDDSSRLPEIRRMDWGSREGFQEFCYQSEHIPVEGCQLTDFDYQNPSVKTVNQPSNLENKRFRHFEYPGYFATRGEGEKKVSRLKKSILNQTRLFRGTSTIRLLSSGKRFLLTAPLLKNCHNRKYLVTDLYTEATTESFLNHFTVIDTRVDYVYPRSGMVKKPQVPGTQTAIVVGNKKDPSKTQTDGEGRIKVRFHWDHHSPVNSENTSAYIRNAVPAAGFLRGFIFTPNIGDEVLVSFLDADPDRPIIIGRVYSINQRPPVDPEKTPYQSAIQAHGDRGANRIVFDDTADSEVFEFTAKENMSVKVGTDLYVKVEDELTLLADNMELTANGSILTGNIVAMSGGDINSVAGATISNTTGLVVADLVGGLDNNKADANIIQLAVGMVKSKSGGPTVSTAPMIFNTTAGDIDLKGEGGVKNIGLIIANTAMDLISNSSAKKVCEKAELAIITNSKNETNDFDKEQTNQALMIKDKGNMVINDG